MVQELKKYGMNVVGIIVRQNGLGMRYMMWMVI